MSKTPWILGAASLAFAAGLAVAQYPIMDNIAAKVISQYQGSTCEQLWQKKGQSPSAEQQRAVSILKSDPQMRTAFINKVAPTIVNKMFDCGMIP